MVIPRLKRKRENVVSHKGGRKRNTISWNLTNTTKLSVKFPQLFLKILTLYRLHGIIAPINLRATPGKKKRKRETHKGEYIYIYTISCISNVKSNKHTEKKKQKQICPRVQVTYGPRGNTTTTTVLQHPGNSRKKITRATSIRRRGAANRQQLLGVLAVTLLATCLFILLLLALNTSREYAQEPRKLN